MVDERLSEEIDSGFSGEDEASGLERERRSGGGARTVVAVAEDHELLEPAMGGGRLAAKAGGRAEAAVSVGGGASSSFLASRKPWINDRTSRTSSSVNPSSNKEFSIESMNGKKRKIRMTRNKKKKQDQKKIDE